MNERESLADCLRRLERAGVAYMVTGSMAALHTPPRPASRDRPAKRYEPETRTVTAASG